MTYVTVDFETYPIQKRPVYPPQPVGVSIKWSHEKARYYAFGHVGHSNPCTKLDAKKALVRAWSCGHLIFHNGKFDIDVAETHFGLPRLTWQAYDDTYLLLFLRDPHSQALGLKEAAHRILGIAPDERDEIIAWLLEHQPVSGTRLTAARNSEHWAGAYVAWAPPTLAAEYANGDTERTELLFSRLYADIRENGMEEAYSRERKLMLILLDMERRGLSVDVSSLQRDISLYSRTLFKLDKWLRKQLQVSSEFNFESGAQLIEGLANAHLIDRDTLPRTEKGNLKTDKTTLSALLGVENPIASALRYRTQLMTCLKTFMEPWARIAETSGGKVWPEWNQVRASSGSGFVGARTGRMSSTPNFQNIPKAFPPLFANEKKGLPKAPFALPALPKVRSYIIPAKGAVFWDRDYSQQELRILAHFEDGKLLEAYKSNPWLDVHEHARVLIKGLTGRDFDRKTIKTAGFGLIYGMGVALLAQKAGISLESAQEVKNAYLAIYPGLKALTNGLFFRGRSGEPIRTWGGRIYRCEKPTILKGVIHTFEYKLLNYLVQGSAADCTKEAIIKWHENGVPGGCRMVLSVHDQLTIEGPPANGSRGFPIPMKALKEAMESIEFDLPMLSEGFVGARNWADLVPFDAKGVRV